MTTPMSHARPIGTPPQPSSRTLSKIARHGVCGVTTCAAFFWGIADLQLNPVTLVAMVCTGCAIVLVDPLRPLWAMIALCFVVGLRLLAITAFGLLALAFGPIAFSFESALWSCVAFGFGMSVGWVLARRTSHRSDPSNFYHRPQ